jgi:glycosyltransferase involved in cell wall biosynthesis
LKILFLNWRDITHPLAGGCELHLHEIGKRLVEAGHEVTLFCGGYASCKEYDKLDGIEIIRRGGRYSVYLCALLEYLTRLRKKNYDVVVDDINGVPFFTPLYVRRPKVAIIHHLVKDIFSRELNLLFRPFGYLAEWLIPKFYGKTCFVTVSNSSREEMKEAGIPAENIKIIHNGISKRYKSNWRLKSPHPRILYLGRLKDYKQLDHLIKAVKIVKDQIADVELSIAGSGDSEDDLKKLAIELDVNTIVKFHGYVDEKKKLHLLQSAWVFVTPSQKEGWGCTVIEANACGTPAIAYDVPGLRDSIKNGETGLLVERRNVNYLAGAIVKLLKDDDLRGKLNRDAQKWSKNFSWDKSAKEFASVLEDITQSN